MSQQPLVSLTPIIPRMLRIRSHAMERGPDGCLSPPPRWEHTEIHLATSADGFNWTTNPTVIGYGGTSCVIEMQDGTLYIYYVNR